MKFRVHASACLFPRLKARDYFDYVGGASRAENPFTRTQAGASLSGPLFSSRTQFFLGVEGSKTNASVEEHFAAPSEQNRLPLTLRFPCSLGFLCSEFGLPSQQPFYFYPKANNAGGPYGTNTWSRELPADGEGVFSSLRLTQQIATAHTLNGKYALSEEQRILPSVNGAIGSTIYSRTRSQNVSLILDSQFTPQVFQQARVSFGRTRIRFPEHPLGKFTEQRNLVIKAEVFNLFHRANFGLPVRTLDAPGFGSAVATVNPARMLQLALKFQF